MNQQRIEFLDGLRGLAIIFVMLFHAYARYPTFVPFGSEFSEIPLFSKGYYGVNLFFLISGFVILMTLEKTNNFFDFMLRRWIRLFPAMLVCTIIIYSTAFFFMNGPKGMRYGKDLLSGLLFIKPSTLGHILHSPQGQLESSFWSLYVEVEFYLLIASLYFFIGRNRALIVIATIFLMYKAIFLIPVGLYQGPLISYIQGIEWFLVVLNAQYLGWFVAGSLFYIYYKQPKIIVLMTALTLAFLSAAEGGFFSVPATAPSLVIILFVVSVLSNNIKKILSNKILLFIGFISYPLYLLHENMLVSLVVKVGLYTPWVPHVLMPIFPILFVIAVGYLIAKYLEPWVRDLIKPYFKQLHSMTLGKSSEAST